MAEVRTTRHRLSYGKGRLMRTTTLDHGRRLAGLSQSALAQRFRLATGSITSEQTIGAWCRVKDSREPTVSEMAILAGLINEELASQASPFRMEYPSFIMEKSATL